MCIRDSHKDFRDIIGAVEMDVVAGGDFDDAPEGEPAGTLHRKGDGVKLHGRAGNIGYGNAVALGEDVYKRQVSQHSS